jgi:signal transduction histidine kinase
MRLVDRYWLLLTAPVVVCLGVYGVLGARFHRQEMLSEAETEVRETATLLGEAVTALPVDVEAAELHALAERLTRDTRVLGIGIYGPDGRWVGGSRVAGAHRGDLEPIVRDAFRGGENRRALRSLGAREALVRVELVRPSQATLVGAVVVLRDLAYLRDAMRAWVVQLAAVAGVLAAVMALLAARLARAMTEPVEQLIVGVSRVAEGDLETEVSAGEDELRRLGDAFNALTRSLRGARERLSDEEAARAALEVELHRAQMLAVAGQVAATLGHEIGSPLNVILGRARVAAEREDVPDDLRASLQSIAAQCERISRVMSQFLSLARPSPSGDTDRSDLGAVAREAVGFLGHECRRAKVRAEVRVQGDRSLAVRAPHDRMFQVLFNLCLNGVQAQPGGGRLEVSVERVEEGGRASVRAVVRDAGPGVAEGIRGKVFDPFFSTRLGAGGTGLGLAVVAGLVRDLGGRVMVDQGDPGSALPGAAFTVWLPAADDEVTTPGDEA